MTTLQNTGTVPEWSMGDRLRKARVETGMSVDEFAARCLVSAKTVNNYEGDKVAQRPLVIEKWAAVTGVNLEWLRTGHVGGDTPPPGPGVDPDPKGDGDALARLTRSKISRSRSSGSTPQYQTAA
jgi:transcriptional regulator with XRE-family HTH domain